MVIYDINSTVCDSINDMLRAPKNLHTDSRLSAKTESEYEDNFRGGTCIKTAL